MNEDKPILAIETSESLCNAALYFSDRKYFVSCIKLKHSHSEKLFEIIEFLFGTTGIIPQQISSVAVSGGPGSFTGLRIGMSAAKGIASGAGVPLVVVPTFEAMAYQLSFQLMNGSVFIISNKVNKDEVYYAKFQIKSNNYIFVDDLTILANEEFVKKAEGVKVFGNSGILPSEENSLFCSPSAEFVAKWALNFGAGNLSYNYDYIEPVYIKNFLIKKRFKK